MRTNIDERILGLLICEPRIHDKAFSQLTEADLAPKWQPLFRVLFRMFKQGTFIDLLSVSKQFEKNAKYTYDEISRLTSDYTPPYLFDNLMVGLKNERLRKEYYRMFEKELSIDDDPVELFHERQKEIEDLIKASTVSETKELIPLIEQALDKDYTQQRSLPFPITKIDQLKLLQPQRLIVFAGRPSHGKTSLATWIVKAAGAIGKKVLIFSLEMTGVELVSRMIGNGQDREEQAGNLSNYQLLINDNGGIDVNYIKRQSYLHVPDLIVIDYLGLMTMPKGEKRTYQIGEVTRTLKTLAKKLNCTILLLAQANREIEGRVDKIHRMSDLADSADIERDADAVIFISRPELFGEKVLPNGDSTKNIVRLHLVKNRHGKALGTLARTNHNMTEFTDYNSLNT